MSKHGKEIISSLEESLAHAEGRPSNVRVRKLTSTELDIADRAGNKSNGNKDDSLHPRHPADRE